jgi:DNA-binding response OmpR family regulator
MSRVLVVEDELHLAEGLRYNLEAEGYDVVICADGENALQILRSEAELFDTVILDVMLPGINGFEVVAALRDAGLFVPVLILTARGRPEDVLSGFESGADDYLAKPFELSILLARLNGLIRRSRWKTAGGMLDSSADNRRSSSNSEKSDGLSSFTFDEKTIDFEGMELRTEDRSVKLTLMETDLLRYLIAHAGKAVSRKEILEEVWNLHEDTDTRAIDNFIVRLRRHIEKDPSRPQHLTTVRGVGYRFVPSSSFED